MYLAVMYYLLFIIYIVLKWLGSHSIKTPKTIGHLEMLDQSQSFELFMYILDFQLIAINGFGVLG